jgi:hypothetical protein
MRFTAFVGRICGKIERPSARYLAPTLHGIGNKGQHDTAIRDKQLQVRQTGSIANQIDVFATLAIWCKG